VVEVEQGDVTLPYLAGSSPKQIECNAGDTAGDRCLEGKAVTKSPCWLPLIAFDRFQMGSWTPPLPGGSTGSRLPDSEGMQSRLTFGSRPRSPCSAPSMPRIFEPSETPTRPLQAASDRTCSKLTNGHQNGPLNRGRTTFFAPSPPCPPPRASSNIRV
jgi:hypothetical protein